MPAALAQRLADAFGWACHYCPVALTPATATVEHIVPRSAGGVTIFRNLTLACGPCNHRFGSAPIKCVCQRCRAARQHIARHHQKARR